MKIRMEGNVCIFNITYLMPGFHLQNIEKGLEFSERAFYHISSTLTTLIAAGKDMAFGNAMLGDLITAIYYLRISILQKVKKYLNIIWLGF
jgi:hypothetical protein